MQPFLHRGFVIESFFSPILQMPHPTRKILCKADLHILEWIFWKEKQIGESALLAWDSSPLLRHQKKRLIFAQVERDLWKGIQVMIGWDGHKIWAKTRKEKIFFAKLSAGKNNWPKIWKNKTLSPRIFIRNPKSHLPIFWNLPGEIKWLPQEFFYISVFPLLEGYF